MYAGEASARYALKRERDRFSESYFCFSTQSLHWHEMACGFSIVWLLCSTRYIFVLEGAALACENRKNHE